MASIEYAYIRLNDGLYDEELRQKLGLSTRTGDP